MLFDTTYRGRSSGKALIKDVGTTWVGPKTLLITTMVARKVESDAQEREKKGVLV